MDSLTQIVLGAACGEIALGKKIGNKAILFGAIGGTIPDLDVILGSLLFTNEIEAMAFHRGFMHSIWFAILGSFMFGFVTYKLYNTKKRKGITTLKNWIWLYFLSIFTHPILDCFTPYGTQLFTPISKYRVAFNTISVVDPLYTLPFLICLIIVLFFKRNNDKRLKFTKLGLFLSSFYLLFTIGNKLYIDSVLKKSFEKKGLNHFRFSAQPTIFNNILWYAVAETNNKYYVTFYSLLDDKNYTNQMFSIDKNHELISKTSNNFKTLTWFSKNYYTLEKIENSNSYKYIDLRYPMLNPNDPNSFLFAFTLFEKNEKWDILPFRGKAPNAKDFSVFWERLKGI